MKKTNFNLRNMIIVAFVAMSTIPSFAQNDRNSKVIISMNDLTYNVKEQKANVGNVLGKVADFVFNSQITQQRPEFQDNVRASIIKGITNGRRTIALDGENPSNVDYIIDAHISNISTTSKIETYKVKDRNKTHTIYKGLIGVTLQVKNAKTGEIAVSPSFNVSDYDAAWIETAEGALMNSMDRLSSYITNYFNRCFPYKANIVEGAREKKDKQKEVYIDLGSSVGAYSGIHFNVYTVKTVAGKEARQKIGKIRITDVQGQDISLCKVQNGGKDIKKAIDNGSSLLIESYD